MSQNALRVIPPVTRLPPFYSGKSCWDTQQEVLIIDVSPVAGCPTLVCLTGWQRSIEVYHWQAGCLESYDNPFTLALFPLEWFEHRLLKNWCQTIPPLVLSRLAPFSYPALGLSLRWYSYKKGWKTMFSVKPM